MSTGCLYATNNTLLLLLLVPHRPRAVALFEDEDFVYFFFREVEWEAMLQPEYSVNRHHFLWKSYDRTISYPWEQEKHETE